MQIIIYDSEYKGEWTNRNVINGGFSVKMKRRIKKAKRFIYQKRTDERKRNVEKKKKKIDEDFKKEYGPRLISISITNIIIIGYFLRKFIILWIVILQLFLSPGIS